MDINEIRNNLEVLPDEIERAEYNYIEAKAQYEYLKDLTKHLLSNLKLDEEGSNPEKETKALASIKYLTHIKGLHSAQVDMGRKGAVLHKLQNQFESMRSLNKNV